MDAHDPRFAATLSHYPASGSFPATPDEYLEHIAKAREALGIPVIASLNGGSAESWLTIARDVQQAGAQALELNLYHLVADPRLAGAVVEDEWVRMVSTLTRILTIPLAVKVTPFFTAFANVARRFAEAGAGGLVLFNRVFQPDVDLETGQHRVQVDLSDSRELLLRLRWLAVLRDRVPADLALTGGAMCPEDGVKGLRAGADVVQLVSALLKHGPGHATVMRQGLEAWMDAHRVETLGQLRGQASLAGVDDPLAFERASYLRALTSWR